MIRLRDFHKSYDQTVAVRGLNFEVQPGQIMGLVGPNGAGKTTTLRALTGILTPSHGERSIAGFDLDEDPLAAKMQLGFVPDDPQLFPDLSVEQHLSFVASTYRVKDFARKADELLEMFELQSKKRTVARGLSRGMRQKLAICCAYIHDPQAILFDEPLTGLDPHGIRMLKSSIVERAQNGAAIMISSHLLAMVEDVCTNVLILESGIRRFLGTMSELKEQFGDDEHGTLEDIYFRATESVDELGPLEAASTGS